LNLAVAANHRALLAHPCTQVILNDLWMGGLCIRKHASLKVIAGLVCPFYITKLEFKSKEEWQLMPQTEEEHTINIEEENKSTEEQPADINRNIGPGAEAIISRDSYGMRNTVVQENGEVVTECDDINQNFHFPLDYSEVKNNRHLKLRRKLYEFYTAPITKFWGHSIAYCVFLITFTYMVLVKMETKPTWEGLYTTIYIFTLACEKVREIVSSEPVAIRHKLSVWAGNVWNLCDAAAIMLFFMGLCLRLNPSSMQIGRLVFSVNSMYWHIRVLNFMAVNRYLGPLVTIIGKMLHGMISFVVILFVVLLSAGVCREAILHPDEEPSWSLLLNIFLEPYLMLFGEIFAESMNPACGDGPDMKKCQAGLWITTIQMGVYLLVANVLLINLLIGVFNNIFKDVKAISHQVWLSQRYRVVMEYIQKPVLPKPLMLLCHIFLLFKYCRSKFRGIRELKDNALKLFLDQEGLERLHDFEEDCIEGYFREQETKLHMSNDDCIWKRADRVDEIYQKVEYIKRKENNLTSAIRGTKVWTRKLEDLANRISAMSLFTHQRMATNVQNPSSMSDLPDVRLGGKSKTV
jgi:transient receptor potential cation channel subfamily M protein 3